MLSKMPAREKRNSAMLSKEHKNKTKSRVESRKF